MRTATFQCLEIQWCSSHSNHNHGHSAWILHPNFRTHSSKCPTHISNPQEKAFPFFFPYNILPAKSQPLQGAKWHLWVKMNSQELAVNALNILRRLKKTKLNDQPPKYNDCPEMSYCYYKMEFSWGIKPHWAAQARGGHWKPYELRQQLESSSHGMIQNTQRIKCKIQEYLLHLTNNITLQISIISINAYGEREGKSAAFTDYRLKELTCKIVRFCILTWGWIWTVHYE